MVLSIANTKAECSFVDVDIDGVGLVYEPQNKILTDQVKTYEKFNIRIMTRDSPDFNIWREFENKMPSRTVGDFYIYKLNKHFETVFFSGTDGQGVSAHQQGAIRAAKRLYKGLYIRYTYPDTYKNPRNADNLVLEVLDKIKVIGE